MDREQIIKIENNDGSDDSRRQFLRKALTAASALAVTYSLGTNLAKAQAGSPAFVNPAEVARRSTGILRAVMELADIKRTIPNGGPPVAMRYFQGWDPADPTKKAPVNAAIANPGPTLRAELGDKVEISFLNTIDDGNFSYSIDTAPEDKKKASFGCDASGTVYPADDAFPNCFHGSSTANLHFHGTHTTPDGLGDNVLVQVLPQKKQPLDWNKFFEDAIFKGNIPQTWAQMPARYRKMQENMVKAADAEAEKQAKAAKRAIPEKMWPTDEHQIHSGVWPQYLIGAFPNYFDIPKYVKGAKYPAMGQAPGTHWYHAHKHGSTALHILSGLAGAFIIEDNSPTGYDGALKAFYGPDFVQNVMVFQMFNPVQNLQRTQNQKINPGQLINGQLTPIITMKPNEVQLWRMVNATMGGNQGTISSSIFTKLIAAGFQVMQTARDGVQFRWENFQAQPYFANIISGGLTSAGGNRADVLVMAPPAPLSSAVNVGPYFVNVAGAAVTKKGFPDQASYPAFPEYLDNLAPPTLTPRVIKFGWADGTIGSGRNAQGIPPHFTIDGKQFEQNGPVIDQCMELGTTEDWIVENWTTVAHPFHIHINPFQVLSIESPQDKSIPLYPAPGKTVDFPIWHDTINIPGGVQTNPTTFTPGRVRIRHKFVDFTGTYVLHCHILAHEDRGMMQLVRVVAPENYKKGCQIDIPMHH